MSKIICDICGTSFSDTEEKCPICGCSKDFRLDDGLTDEFMEEEAAAPAHAKGGRFAAKSKRAPVYEEEDEDDEDEYDEDEDDDDFDDYDDEDDDDDDDDYDDDDEEEHKSNAPLVVLLVIIILALMAVSGFILVKYFIPSMLPQETTAPATEATTLPPESTELRIPCENLALTSGGEVVLDMEGANWLINVLALPENTTDKLEYASSDESVAVVDAQGKVTAVGEGTAVITITCGEQELLCTVTCDFTPETTAPETEPVTEPVETTAPVTEPEETTEPTEPLKDITLKVIRWTELQFNGPNQGFTFVLDGLRNDEVKWTSMDESIVTVDENGRVLNHGKGTTTIICEYGDQKVEIKVISNW